MTDLLTPSLWRQRLHALAEPGRRGWLTACTAIAIVLGVGAATGVAAMLRRPLWLDEILTHLVATDANGLLHGLRAGIDFQPPPFYVLVHGVTQLAGVTAFAERAPSVVAAALAVLVFGALLGTRLSIAAALTGAIALAAHPLFVSAAFEARPYALWMLGGVLLPAAFSAARRRTAFVAAAAVLVVWAHYFGVLALATIGIAIVAYARWGERRAWPAVVRYALPLCAGAAALAVLLPFARLQLAATGGRSWVPQATAAQTFEFLRFPWAWRPIVLLVTVALVATALARIPFIAQRWRPRRIEMDATLVALLGTALVPVLVVLVSVTVTPVVVLRYSTPAVIAAATVAALAVERLPAPVRWLAVLYAVRALRFSDLSAAADAESQRAQHDATLHDVRVVTATGIVVASLDRHDAYRLALPIQGGAPVAWIDVPDSTLDALARRGAGGVTRNFLLVERDFGRAASRNYAFPSVAPLETLRRAPDVALMRSPDAAGADSLLLPGRVYCALTPRIVLASAAPVSRASERCERARAALAQPRR